MDGFGLGTLDFKSWKEVTALISDAPPDVICNK